MARGKKSLNRLLLPLGKTAARVEGAPDGADDPALLAIWDVIARIPRGCVTTYGDVARAAGLPGRARQAGYALKHAPDRLHLPWHRVVGAGGRIAFPEGTRAHREQARLLASEGVQVSGRRVARSALLPPDDLG